MYVGILHKNIVPLHALEKYFVMDITPQYERKLVLNRSPEGILAP